MAESIGIMHKHIGEELMRPEILRQEMVLRKPFIYGKLILKSKLSQEKKTINDQQVLNYGRQGQKHSVRIHYNAVLDVINVMS